MRNAEDRNLLDANTEGKSFKLSSDHLKKPKQEMNPETQFQVLLFPLLSELLDN